MIKIGVTLWANAYVDINRCYICELVRGEQKRQNKRKTPDVLCFGGKTLSTTEALCVQLDNVCRELHELQVEIKRLWAQGEGEALEQLKEDGVAELWQQFHVAQENKADTN